MTVSSGSRLHLDLGGSVVLVLVRPQKYRGSLLTNPLKLFFLRYKKLFCLSNPYRGKENWFLPGCYELYCNTPETRAGLDVYLPGKPAFDFLKPRCSHVVYGSQKKGISKRISCNLNHARWGFQSLYSCSIASPEARVKQHNRGSHIQSASAVRRQQWRAAPNTWQAAACCLFPLSVLVMLRSVATNFSCDVKIPLTAQYPVHMKAEEAEKRKESRQGRMQTRNAVSSVMSRTSRLFSMVFLGRHSQLWGNGFRKMWAPFAKVMQLPVLNVTWVLLQLNALGSFSLCSLLTPWMPVVNFSPFVNHFCLISDSLLQQSRVQEPGQDP